MKYWRHIVFGILALMFVYTRVVGLDWGLPYPMHPDERNMAVALQSLHCGDMSDIKECFNPHFFAYGQFPLYFGYAVVTILHLIAGTLASPVNFVEATVSLRVLSVLSSLATLYFLLQLVHLLSGKKKRNQLMALVIYLLFTFVPYGIQFAHFGTTESFLMALYTGITYFSMKLLESKKPGTTILIIGLLSGLAVATKISAVLFLLLPLYALLQSPLKKIKKLQLFILFCFLSISCAALFSPHNIISFEEFRTAMNFEVSIGRGTIIAFYNRQFDHTIPFIFQLSRVFPFALGQMGFILGLIGFFLLPYNKNNNLLRAAILFFFLPSAFLYAKWSRFIAPVLPIFTVFIFMSCVFLYEKFKRKYVLCVILFIMLSPGIAYLSIYHKEDVRTTASRWIVKNISEQSSVLSETANVVDIPLYGPTIGTVPPLEMTSFDFYHIDEDAFLFDDVTKKIDSTDYIFIPSRRIFSNHTCYRFDKGIPTERKSGVSNIFLGYRQDYCQYVAKKYPALNAYYDDLFGGRLGFEKVAEISSFPEISLFGKTLYRIDDEDAEETWTVFDHPVIRIYKRS